MRWLLKTFNYLFQQIILTLAVIGTAFGIYVLYETLANPGEATPGNLADAFGGQASNIAVNDVSYYAEQYAYQANQMRLAAGLPLLTPSPALTHVAQHYADYYAEIDDVQVIDFVVLQADLNNSGYTLGGIIYQLPAYVPQANHLGLPQHMMELTQADVLDERLGHVGFAVAPASDDDGYYISLLLAQPLYLTAPGASYGIIGGESQESQQSEILALLNAARAERGLSTLSANAILANAAYNHSLDQATYNTMTHTGSDGSRPTDRAERAGYRGDFIGENVLERPNRHASAAFDQWWNSGSHRRTMLHPDFTEIGIAYAIAADGQHYYTMLLGRP